MQGKKISKGTRLNRMIAVELLCLLILVVVYIGMKITTKGSDEVSGKPGAETTITPTPGETETPKEEEQSISPGAEPITPSVTVTPKEDAKDQKDTVTDDPAMDGETEQGEEELDSLQAAGGNQTGEEAKETSSNLGNKGLSQEAFLASLEEAQSGEVLSANGAKDIIYYMQTDERWGQKFYGGSDTIGEFGCGPTSLAMVISTLTNVKVDPVQMCQWAYDRGYWYSSSGSIHGLIPDAAKAFGLSVEGIENTPEAVEKLKSALSAGNFVIALMGKGTFTNSGHFIVLRGITEDGKILVADPNSKELTKESYDPAFIVNEAKAWAAENGPFWVISK